jgi:hypothetical protein
MAPPLTGGKAVFTLGALGKGSCPKRLVYKHSPPTPAEPLRVKYCNTPFSAMFTYTFEYMVYNSEQSDIKAFLSYKTNKVWKAPLHCPKNAANVLEAVLSAIETICNKESAPTQYLLRLFGDRFIPLAIWIETHVVEDCPTLFKEAATKIPKSECLFSDINYIRAPLTEACGFWRQNVSHYKDNALLHLLAKCLPQRCQVRNLNRVTLQYVENDDSIAKKLHHILLCGLLANYRTSKRHPYFATRYVIFKKLQDPSTLKTVLQKHFTTILFAMKQFIRGSIETVPSLRTLLVQSADWEQFETHVDEAMRAICTDLEVSPEDTFLQRMVFVLDTRLGRKSHRVSLKTTRKYVAARNVRLLVEQKNHHDVLKKHLVNIYRSMCRVPINAPIPWYMLVTLGVKRNIVRALYDETSNKDKLRGLIQGKTKETIRRFLNVYDLRNHIRFYKLPKHHHERQTRALRKRFALRKDEPLDPNAAQFWMCTQCKTVKSFAKNCAQTFGNASVLLDDETLVYYCAQHKSQKNIPAKDEGVCSFLKGMQKKIKPRKFRTDKYAHCMDTPLLRAPAQGVLLYFFNSLFIICPHCAHVRCLENMGFCGGFLCCKLCIEKLN